MDTKDNTTEQVELKKRQGVFFGGIPTKPDVNRLHQELGKPDVGDLIQHETFERIIGKNRASSRYRTVIHAWKKDLFQRYNLDLEAVPGVGQKVLKGPERVDASIRGGHQALRKIRKSGVRCNAAPESELNSEQLRKKQHTCETFSKINDAFSQDMRLLSAKNKALKCI